MRVADDRLKGDYDDQPRIPLDLADDVSKRRNGMGGVIMKFNIHYWTGDKWEYFCTIKEKNEKDALQVAKWRYGSDYRLQVYPHIDNFQEVH